jgi:hypothetical protein
LRIGQRGSDINWQDWRKLDINWIVKNDCRERNEFGVSFSRRAEYLRLLEQYKENLEAMQNDIIEELKEVADVVEKLKRE